MSAPYEHAVERRVAAKHELTKLQTRSLYGDDVPTTEEWGAALVELREAAFAVALASLTGEDDA